MQDEQLTAHKQSSEQTRQIFSEKLHGLTKTLTSIQRRTQLNTVTLFDTNSEPWPYKLLKQDRHIKPRREREPAREGHLKRSEVTGKILMIDLCCYNADQAQSWWGN